MISNLEITEKCTQSEEDVTQSEESKDTTEKIKEALRSDPLTSSSSECNDRSILERSTSTILTSMEVVAVENDVEIDTHNPETMLQIFLQSFIPFFLGGIGSILAGLLCMYVNRTFELVKEVPELLVLIPPLQGLKGNLDMTFSARMSTMAHIGEFDRPGIRGKVLRNVAVTEAQSVYVCLIANFISFLIVLLRLDDTFEAPTNETTIHNTTPHIYLHNFLFLASSSIIAVAINCGISTTMLALVVNYTWKNNLNPDNIVTPLGASVGDLLTISGVVVLCYLLRPLCEFSDWFPVSLLTISVLFIPIWLILAKKDKLAMKTAKQQCATLILSTSISCIAGLIQSKGALTYPNYPAYQTLISGLTGNRCAVQASRISSHLEVKKQSELSWEERFSPFSYYTSKANECKTARLLLFTSLPFQLFFMTLSYTISFLIGLPVEDSPWFFLGYSIAVLIQVAIIMFITQLIVVGLWNFGLDPDIHAIPMMTAAADVCGCGFLYVLFIILDSTCGCVLVKK